MLERLNIGITAFNKLDTRLFIFVLLCLNYLTFNLTSNEEFYFALAKQFVDPDWLPHSFSLVEWPATRFLYQLLVGSMLSFLSFEQTAFFSRLLSCLLFAFPLARLFRHLKLTNLEVLFLLQVIYFGQQSLFAGEWIFGAFKPKTLAYVSLFYGLDYLLSGKHLKGILATLVATYIHALVGSWFALIYFLYLAVRKQPLRTILRLAALYMVVVAPLLVYLAKPILIDNPTAINGINLDWIYVYFRHPHHLAPFKSLLFFAREFLAGVLVSLAWFLLCIFVFRSLEDQHVRKLNLLNIITFSILFASLLFAIFDRNGVYLKFYPFRISALSMLFIILQSAIMLKKYILPERYATSIAAILLCLSLPGLADNSLRTVRRLAEPHVRPDLETLADYVREHTDQRDVFIFTGFQDQEDELSFSRKTRRENFVLDKFVPTGGKKLYEWYQRLQQKEQIGKDLEALFELTDTYRVDYLVANRPHEHQRLIPVYQNTTYFVYRID
ncbi:MAG: hypothetical protein JSW54_00460 [Fidelibacterota bacterium]|nr:MAG: hypothetical protein JSW54_00460 [Candidatus Neomarinimicrobiota bacterium]